MLKYVTNFNTLISILFVCLFLIYFSSLSLYETDCYTIATLE